MPMHKTQNGKWTDLNLMDQEYPEAVKEQYIRIGRIIDANYEKANFEQEVNKLIHLTKLQRVILLSCIKQYEDMFDGNIGEWTGSPIEIPLKDEANPYQIRAFPITVIHL